MSREKFRGNKKTDIEICCREKQDKMPTFSMSLCADERSTRVFEFCICSECNNRADEYNNNKNGRRNSFAYKYSAAKRINVAFAKNQNVNKLQCSPKCSNIFCIRRFCLIYILFPFISDSAAGSLCQLCMCYTYICVCLCVLCLSTRHFA